MNLSTNLETSEVSFRQQFRTFRNDIGRLPPRTYPLPQRQLPRIAKKLKQTTKGSHKAVNLTPSTMRNFGTAICAYILSEEGMISINGFANQQMLEIEDLNNYIVHAKELFEESGSFETLLMTRSNDTYKTTAYKRILKDISINFMKYHCKEWIQENKNIDRDMYFRCRLKMLEVIRSL